MTNASEPMRLGILQCDSVRTELQPEFGNYPGMFEQLLASVLAPVSLHVHDLRAGERPTSTDACDAWLITGSSFGVEDGDEWIAHAHDLVRRLHADRRPMIGICFGHQLIANALGGDAGRAGKGWGVGVHFARLVEQPAWMTGPTPAEFALPVSHQDQVHAMPPGARCLATSDFCPISMMQLDDHILTFQGHPEFQRDYVRAVMDRRRERLGETVYQEGQASLARVPDTALVAAWIAEFLTSTGARAPRSETGTNATMRHQSDSGNTP